jgi:hypothetical protein
MKTTFGIQPVIPLAILLFLNSCSKNNVMNKRDSKDTVQVFEVEYSISPVNKYVANISYIDSNSKVTTLNHLTGLESGSIKMTFAGKPGGFWVSAVVNNTSYFEQGYTLSLAVNGLQKQSVHFSVAAGSPSTLEKAEYDLTEQAVRQHIFLSQLK